MKTITNKAFKERPILFSGPMVRAILEGRKTQTRRIIKPQPPKVWDRARLINPESPSLGFVFENSKDPDFHGYPKKQFPYGQPGDRLWVRETFVLENGAFEYRIEPPTDGTPFKVENVSDGEGGEDDQVTVPHYKATEPDAAIYPWDCMNGDCEHDFPGEEGCNHTRWKPSIHMPRWASRIDLELVKVRVERLQEITPEDAIAEGIDPKPHLCGCEICSRTAAFCPATSSSIVMEYRELWERINGPESWHANPWVWVIEFQRLTK